VLRVRWRTRHGTDAARLPVLASAAAALAPHATATALEPTRATASVYAAILAAALASAAALAASATAAYAATLAPTRLAAGAARAARAAARLRLLHRQRHGAAGRRRHRLRRPRRGAGGGALAGAVERAVRPNGRRGRDAHLDRPQVRHRLLPGRLVGVPLDG
jgi:hypothetical protein